MIAPLTDYEFQQLVLFVRRRCGINLEKKRTLIESILSRDIEHRGFRSYSSYFAVVMRHPDGEECRHMINRLSTNYTFFFRERDAYSYVVKKVVPAFLAGGGKCLNVWDAGCSGGEEAYSLAMVLSHTTAVQSGALDYKILASDLNTDQLAIGRAGSYPEKLAEGIPPLYRHFYRRTGEQIQISPELTRHIEFRYENLLDCPYNDCWDLIFCRNVMIYFNRETRDRLVKKLYEALRPGGCLILGATECIDLNRRLFLHAEPTVYIKQRR